MARPAGESNDLSCRRHHQVQRDGISLRSIVIALAVLGCLAYLLVLPWVGNVIEQNRDRPAQFVVEEQSTWELIPIRLAKLFVFSVFVYCGACLGSFLNVVAACVPRGDSVLWRSSACPKCQAPIRRSDNLPIYGYLVLKGRCRACEVPIPTRYFVVEVIAASIFGLLFLYELVTGAENVPGFRPYLHKGILWIILYTKWPVVGIYCYHVLMFSFLLTFALMDADRLKSPPVFSAGVIGLFAVWALVAPLLQPVAVDDHLPLTFSEMLPAWAGSLVTSLAGGAVGWELAWMMNRFRVERQFMLSMVLLGVTLGWQAVATISLIWAIASLILLLAGKFRPVWLGPTALLFTVAMLHHPVWKLISRLW